LGTKNKKNKKTLPSAGAWHSAKGLFAEFKNKTLGKEDFLFFLEIYSLPNAFT